MLEDAPCAILGFSICPPLQYLNARYMESLARVLFLRDYVLPIGLPLCFRPSFHVNRVGFFPFWYVLSKGDLGLFGRIFFFPVHFVDQYLISDKFLVMKQLLQR